MQPPSNVKKPESNQDGLRSANTDAVLELCPTWKCVPTAIHSSIDNPKPS